ncbi:MAG: hypothetical protein ACK4TL_00095 [Hyphomicrobiaceae bacterium]
MSRSALPTVILDSVTHLAPAHRGAVVHAASHGGTYAAAYAAAKGVAAVILNDAGIGRARAGVAGLELLAGLGVPGAAIAHTSARIGDGRDGMARGILSTVNAPAAALGLAPGMSCREALEKLAAAPLMPSPAPPETDEARHEIASEAYPGAKVIVMDSASLVTPGDAGGVIVTASHGGLLGGKPETAIKVAVFAAVYNDADRGIDNAGISRLPALDAHGIAGACVSAFSARIGDGLSTYRDGFISTLNATAVRYGGRIGQSTAEFCDAMLSASQ